jgi:hypothetical protein
LVIHRQISFDIVGVGAVWSSTSESYVNNSTDTGKVFLLLMLKVMTQTNRDALVIQDAVRHGTKNANP